MNLTISNRIFAAINRRVRRLRQWIDGKFVENSGKMFLSNLYYRFFNSSFEREQLAVLAGRKAFESSRGGVGNTSSLLRRNIHRLEKGILMRPRRPVFGLEYIEETLKQYEMVSERYRSGFYQGIEEITWAHDVLETYFMITGAEPKVDKLRERFQALPPVNGDDERDLSASPYAVKDRKPPSTDYMAFHELARNRKSVRWFLEKKVPRELIEKLVDAARYSPSACNRQPFFFRVFDDPDLVGRVAGLPGGTKGFAENIPVIIAVIGEQRNYYGERDRHLIYIDASLAVMSLVLAAETSGLATCCINWPDIEEYEQQAETVLKLEPDQRPVMFVALGYPDPTGMVAYSEKKPVEELCRFNFE